MKWHTVCALTSIHPTVWAFILQLLCIYLCENPPPDTSSVDFRISHFILHCDFLNTFSLKLLHTYTYYAYVFSPKTYHFYQTVCWELQLKWFRTRGQQYVYASMVYMCVCQTEDTQRSLYRLHSTVFGILFSLEAALFSPSSFILTGCHSAVCASQRMQRCC